MIKYLFTVAIAGLTLAQDDTTNQTAPKCIPRRPPGNGGPIPTKIGTTVRPYPPPSGNGGGNGGGNWPRNWTKPTSSTSDSHPTYDDATYKAAQTLLNSQWQAYLTSNGSQSSTNNTTPPPAGAWLRYQQQNNLTDPNTIPDAFFQKWQTDMSKAPQGVPTRPVGPDGNPIPFCDETSTGTQN